MSARLFSTDQFFQIITHLRSFDLVSRQWKLFLIVVCHNDTTVFWLTNIQAQKDGVSNALGRWSSVDVACVEQHHVPRPQIITKTFVIFPENAFPCLAHEFMPLFNILHPGVILSVIVSEFSTSRDVIQINHNAKARRGIILVPALLSCMYTNKSYVYAWAPGCQSGRIFQTTENTLLSQETMSITQCTVIT